MDELCLVYSCTVQGERDGRDRWFPAAAVAFFYAGQALIIAFSLVPLSPVLWSYNL